MLPVFALEENFGVKLKTSSIVSRTLNDRGFTGIKGVAES